jgi:DivIVA domain-containing protein
MKKQKLSVDEIIEHKFKKQMFRGISVDAVDDFLNMILDDYEYFIEKIKDLDKANEELRNENFRIKMDVLKQATHTLDIEEIKEARREMEDLFGKPNTDTLLKIADLEKELEVLKNSL